MQDTARVFRWKILFRGGRASREATVVPRHRTRKTGRAGSWSFPYFMPQHADASLESLFYGVGFLLF